MRLVYFSFLCLILFKTFPGRKSLLQQKEAENKLKCLRSGILFTSCRKILKEQIYDDLKLAAQKGDTQRILFYLEKGIPSDKKKEAAAFAKIAGQEICYFLLVNELDEKDIKIKEYLYARMIKNKRFEVDLD